MFEKTAEKEIARISVIVPVYHIRAYLPRCMGSLLSQQYDNFEIILVDDGSTDGSGALCDAYAAQDARVRVVHKQNGGLSSARNAGLDIARGEYLLFLDGDDYLSPDALQRLMEVAGEAGEFDFIQFHYAETDGSWMPDPAQKANAQVCTEPREMFRYLYQRGGVAASACTKLYRRALFESLRFREGIAHEDEELITRLLPVCRRVIYTDLVLYGYVMRGGSIIHDKFNRHRLDVMEIMDERVDRLRALGFEEWIPETRRRQFCTAAMLYCQARRADDRMSAAQLRQRLRALAKESGLPLSGQYRALQQLTRVCPWGPELYYLVRRVCGKS